MAQRFTHVVSMQTHHSWEPCRKSYNVWCKIRERNRDYNILERKQIQQRDTWKTMILLMKGKEHKWATTFKSTIKWVVNPHDYRTWTTRRKKTIKTNENYKSCRKKRSENVPTLINIAYANTWVCTPKQEENKIYMCYGN